MFFAPIADSFVRGFVRRQSVVYFFRLAFFEQLGVALFIATMIWLSPGFYCTYYFAVFFFSRLTDYQNHVGCDEASPYSFANNVLSERYNWVRYNFGYHTAHHCHPDAHWSELPGLHELIAPKIPAERISWGSWTGLLTPPWIAYWMQQGFHYVFSRQPTQLDPPGNDE
ncbi:MAG: fatty acid desaturase [Planctomycetaceae bacterium]